MLGGHWDISRGNHSARVYTRLSPLWDTAVQRVPQVPHLRVKRPTEQSGSGGQKKSHDSYLIGMLQLPCGQRDPYTTLGGRGQFCSSRLHIDYVSQWNYPLNISNGGRQFFNTLILFCWAEIGSCCNCFFPVNNGKKAQGGTDVPFEQGDYASVLK